MSTFSQFAGGSGTEVGQFLDGFIPLNVGGTHPSDVVTYKGKTYVKCNQFRSFLAASYPDLYALYGDGIGENVVGESKATITTANSGSQYVAGGYCFSYTLNGTPAGKYSTNNGLTIVAERFKAEKLAGHVTLTKGERSALAELATHVL